MRQDFLSRVNNGFSLRHQLPSRVTIQIELPLPVKRFYEFYLTSMAILTGKQRGTWKDFITGEHVSRFSRKLSFIFSVLLYTATLVLALVKPTVLPYFWIPVYTFLHYCRYEIFAHSVPNGVFFLIDYCYYAGLVMMITFGLGLKNNSDMYAVAFALQTGASLNSVIFMPGVNSLTFSSKSTISHLQLVYLHFVPSVCLFFDLQAKKYNEPWIYDSILSRFSPTNDILRKHILQPYVAIVLWNIVYLILTEVIYYKRIYKSGTPHYTQTSYNFGYNRAKKYKGLQRLLGKQLKKLRLVKSKERFKPESNYKHHLFAIGIYNFFSQFGFLAMLFSSFALLRNQQVFGIYLSILFLVIVYNGSEKMINEELKIVQSMNSMAFEESSSDSDKLDEGGSLSPDRWDKVYEDKLLLRTEESNFEFSAREPSKEPEEDAIPIPEPLNQENNKEAIAEKDI